MKNTRPKLTAEDSQKRYWPHPFDGLKSTGWPGMANCKYLAAIVFTAMRVRHSIFRCTQLFSVGQIPSLLSVMMVASCVTKLKAADAPAVPVTTTNLLRGFRQLNFSVDGRDCLLVVPTVPATGNPWIWRTEFFGVEPQGDLALLSKGWHVAYMNLENMYGAPVGLDHMDRFYEALTGRFQLAPKTVLEGFSRGGLFAFNWAARHPDRVACLYVDAPVCDLKSWPAGWGKSVGSPDDWVRCKAIYGLNDEQARTFKGNPVDNLTPLAKAKIPILSVCGAADVGVPMAENTLVVQERYEKLGGEIKVISKPGVGHHPHSLSDPQPIVDFILQHSTNN